jgi:hypothetical protein
MRIFTLKARRLVNRAVNAYGNDHQRETWRSWAVSHPDVRRGPPDPYEDGAGSLSPEVTAVARSVLNQMFDEMERRAKSGGLSVDDEVDISNDLAFIRSLVNSLGHHAPRQASVGPGVSF